MMIVSNGLKKAVGLIELTLALGHDALSDLELELVRAQGCHVLAVDLDIEAALGVDRHVG